MKSTAVWSLVVFFIAVTFLALLAIDWFSHDKHVTGNPPAVEVAGGAPVRDSQLVVRSFEEDRQIVTRRSIAAPDSLTPGDTYAERPSDTALRKLQSVIEIEVSSLGEQMRIAETVAGDSVAAFTVFLKKTLDFQLRVEARKSLAADDVKIVMRRKSDNVFKRPYLRYSTSDLVDGEESVICVPVLSPEHSMVTTLREAWAESKEAVLHNFIGEHNMKSDQERMSGRASWEAGTLPGLPPDLQPWLRYRLHFVDGDFARIRP
jgi:hypothetical protein